MLVFEQVCCKLRLVFVAFKIVKIFLEVLVEGLLSGLFISFYNLGI